MAIQAAIDVGSNSVKLLVAEVEDDGSYKVLFDESRVTGLATGLRPGLPLNPDNAEQTFEALRGFIEKATELGAKRINAAGTSALRDASDAEAFITRVGKKLGLDVRIISGKDEARISRIPALREIEVDSHVLLFDIGGGSTELSWLSPLGVEFEDSLQLGARRMTDMLQVQQPVPQRIAAALALVVQERLAAAGPEIPHSDLRIIGLGGTANNAARMLLPPSGDEKPVTHLSRIARHQLEDLQARIAVLSLDVLKQWPNLNPERAPLMFAGVTILIELLRHYGASEFTLIDRGLRYGLLLEKTG